jgi:hypothetical protein
MKLMDSQMSNRLPAKPEYSKDEVRDKWHRINPLLSAAEMLVLGLRWRLLPKLCPW